MTIFVIIIIIINDQLIVHILRLLILAGLCPIWTKMWIPIVHSCMDWSDTQARQQIGAFATKAIHRITALFWQPVATMEFCCGNTQNQSVLFAYPPKGRRGGARIQFVVPNLWFGTEYYSICESTIHVLWLEFCGTNTGVRKIILIILILLFSSFLFVKNIRPHYWYSGVLTGKVYVYELISTGEKLHQFRSYKERSIAVEWCMKYGEYSNKLRYSLPASPYNRADRSYITNGKHSIIPINLPSTPK